MDNGRRTIPMNNALEELVKGTTVTKNVGYVCSRVVWTDGMIHKMNYSQI